MNGKNSVRIKHEELDLELVSVDLPSVPTSYVHRRIPDLKKKHFFRTIQLFYKKKDLIFITGQFWVSLFIDTNIENPFKIIHLNCFEKE